MALTIHLFRHFCCMMYRLATVHSVTDRRNQIVGDRLRQIDRQTDRQTYDIIMPTPIILVQFDRLKVGHNVLQ